MQCHICQEGWSSSTLTSVGQADTTNSPTVHFDARRTLSRRPTMRHVAALAGVSLRTVSRVINDDPTVAEALRDQVRAAVDRLNYRPNLVAKSFPAPGRPLLHRRAGPTRCSQSVLGQDTAGRPGAVRALLSRQENHRTALVGFDDFETADLLEPGVTVVTHDPDTFGSLATEVLFRRIEGDKSPTSEHIQKVKLIKRGSGEIPPARRAGLAAFE